MLKISMLISIFFLNIFACNVKEKDIFLPGKIAVIFMPFSNTCKIYENSDNPLTSFTIKNIKGIKYAGFLHRLIFKIACSELNI